MSSQPALIRLRGVSKVYGTAASPVNALRDVSLDVFAGEYLSVMGPSGSGKSTLFNMIGALDRATACGKKTPGVFFPAPARQRMDRQLAARPVVNEAVRVEPVADGGLDLSVPLRHRRWSRRLKRLLSLSDERRVTLDRFGAEFLGLCDGERMLEAIVGLYMERWSLSFFEARALVIGYLRDLMRRGLVVLVAP